MEAVYQSHQHIAHIEPIYIEGGLVSSDRLYIQALVTLEFVNRTFQERCWLMNVEGCCSHTNPKRCTGP